MKATLPQTKEALSSRLSNFRLGLGEHIDPRISTGPYGVPLGETEFDPRFHDATDIDHGSVGELIFGQPYVQEILPDKPLVYTVVADQTSRQGHPAIARQKQHVTRVLRGVLSEDTVIFGDIPINEDMVGDNRIAFTTVLDEAPGSPVFGLSDFSRFEPRSYQRFDELVAIKINHLLERQIPANVGRLSLGGSVELNTNNPRHLASFNERLDQEHQAVLAKLGGLGAKVVCITVNPSLPYGFDVPTADSDIAKAINDLQN